MKNQHDKDTQTQKLECLKIQQRISEIGIGGCACDKEILSHLVMCDECLVFAESLKEADPLPKEIPEDKVSNESVKEFTIPVSSTKSLSTLYLSMILKFTFFFTAIAIVGWVVGAIFSNAGPNFDTAGVKRSMSADAPVAGESAEESEFSDSRMDKLKTELVKEVTGDKSPLSVTNQVKVLTAKQDTQQQKLGKKRTELFGSKSQMDFGNSMLTGVNPKPTQEIPLLEQSVFLEKEDTKNKGIRMQNGFDLQRSGLYDPSSLEGKRELSEHNNETIKGNVLDGLVTVGGIGYPHESSDKSYNSSYQEFFSKLNSLNDLTFKEAAGYWKNTYIPGEPYYRALYHTLGLYSGSEKELIEPVYNAMHPSKRPFDLPQNSALGIYLQASKTDIKERSRVLLQVGLQATERHSGARPAMNVGIVLDLRGNVLAREQQIFRSIVTAFEKAKDLGDRFSLTVAGVHGGTVVLPDDFKHGPITVLFDKLFGNGTKGESLPLSLPLSLADALTQATQVVRKNDSPETTLGSSVVVLVTSSAIESHESAELVDFVQQNAIAGIPLSVIGVGDKFDSTELDNLVLAGQGNKRIVLNPNESQELVQKELAATSKVVARAVRLNILLSPGVKLVDVLGSSRLDSRQTERVKDSEKSIDNRISKNLGIEADRGEDDAGIQIIIPTFYSNDSHVILLDVVASGPGSIATVTARFKDLVFLRNGVSKASLELDSFPKKETPLVKDVIKNRLAIELIDVLNTASKELRDGDWDKALKVFENHKSLLQDVIDNEFGFARDEDILNDISIISECINMLRNHAFRNNHHGGEVRLSYFADAFEYTAFRKILPAPNALR